MPPSVFASISLSLTSMNDLALYGRNWTIRIFASVLLISIYTIVSYNLVVENIETKKIAQQAIRFALTVLLIYFVFKGKRWATTVLTVLFSIAIAGGIITLFSNIPLAGKIPLLTMTVIYSIAIYHLNFAASFKEYAAYLNRNSEA
jgi:hypothetical protein